MDSSVSTAAFYLPSRGSLKALQVSKQMATTLTAAKTTLTAATPLVHPLPGADLSLAADASNSHAGPVLQQLQGGFFFFCKLTPTQQQYSASDC
jgi:hypothetical protein